MQAIGPTSATGTPLTANDQSAAANAQEAPAAAQVASAPPPAVANAAAATQVSISEAAQAYLSQPNPPSISEIQREKKKPKMKTLLEHMLEWSRKYEEQRDQAQKEKQLAPSPDGNAAKAAAASPAPLAPLAIKKGADRTETE